VHARVELVGLGMAERESFILPTKNHITTAEVPARVESVGFLHRQVVFS
jgi:hypothetical protein